MDMAINPAGDFDIDSGKPYEIEGTEEIMQRIYICLTAHRGNFIYDRELGGELYKIEVSENGAENILEVQAREAIKCIPNAEICEIHIVNGIVYALVSVDGWIRNIAIRRN